MGWKGKSTRPRKWEDAAITAFVSEKPAVRTVGLEGLWLSYRYWLETDPQPLMRPQLNSRSTFCCMGPPMDHLVFRELD